MQRNWFLATKNLIFYFYISATWCRRPMIVKNLNSVRSNSFNLKNLGFMTSGCKNIENFVCYNTPPQCFFFLGGGCQPKWVYSINLLFMSNKAYGRFSEKCYVLVSNFDRKPTILLKTSLIGFFNTLLWLNQGFVVLPTPLNLFYMAVRIYLYT